jgi:beta-galactosidase
MKLVVPPALSDMEWYGRGPGESYWDRNTATLVGRYEVAVSGQYFPYVRPQESGNKTDVRWLALSDGQGTGLLFVPLTPFVFSGTVRLYAMAPDGKGCLMMR